MFEIFGDSSKPSITQFPELIIIFDPVKQITINVDRKKIIILDGRVSSYTERDLEKFIRFSRAVYESLLEDGIIAYGLNIGAVGDIDEVDSAAYLAKNFIQSEKFGETIEATGAGARLVFNAAGIRTDLRVEPIFAEGPMQVPTKSLSFNQNSNFVAKTLPALTEFETQTKSIYNELPVLLGKILV